MERELVEASVIDFIGLLLFGGVLSLIMSPPLGLSSKQLTIIGLVFPLFAYVVTYQRYPEQFWNAFLGSLVSGMILFAGGFWLFINVVI